MNEHKWKKRLTYVTIGVFFLLGGVEYAVILPTVWLYLQDRFDSEQYMLGIVLSAFSFSGLIAGPLMGRWSDKTGNTKLVILVANLFEIAGNLMYFIGLSDWFLVAGRFVAGIGAGVGSAIFADIARVTSTGERTGTMAILMAVRQTGLIAGPGLNLFLRMLHFHVGPFPVDAYTAPGLFMAILWTILEFMVLFMYWNLPALYRDEKAAILKRNIQYSSSNGSLAPDDPLNTTYSSSYHQRAINADVGGGPPSLNNSQEVTQNWRDLPRYQPSSVPRPLSWIIGTPVSEQNNVASSSDNIVHAENYMSSSPGYLQYTEAYANADASEDTRIQRTGSGNLNSNANRRRSRSYSSTSSTISEPLITNGCDTAPEIGSSKEETSPEIKVTWSFMYHEYIREEVVVILSIVFAAFFNQMVLETMCTPLTRQLLHWEEFGNSLLYCGAGVQIVLVFIGIRLLSKRISDRWIILFACLILLVTDAFLLWFVPQAYNKSPDENLWGLMFGTFLDLIGIPCLSVIGTSLYSKVTRPESQGFSQGIRRAVAFIAMILAPLWAGSMLHDFYIMLGVCLALNALVFVMFLLSFKYLKEPSSSSNLQIQQPDNERRPLLS